MGFQKLSLFALSIFISSLLSAQTDSVETSNIENDRRDNKFICFYPAGEQAKFPGGDSTLFAFFRKQIFYSDSMGEIGITGTLYLEFIIEKDGTPTSFKVLRSPSSFLSIEALKAAKLMPRWKPAIQNRKAVKMRYVLPMKFRRE